MDIIAAARDVPPPDHIGSKSDPELDMKEIVSAKPLSFINGALKRHRHAINPNPPAEGVVAYKECLKNHAAALGGHALDGCGEFMPSPSTNPNLTTSIKCAVCGCHRNFHRRDPEESLRNLKLLAPPPPLPSHVVEYQPQHRHRSPQPLASARASSPNPASPPPISSYLSSAPHMLLALSTGFAAPEMSQLAGQGVVAMASNPVPGRKRFRTKFSNVQKEKMYAFAERIGWRMHKRDAELVNQFCKDIGVERGVFKVWMHNNKSTILGKRSLPANGTGCNNNGFIHHQEDAKNGEVNTQQQKQLHTPHSLLNHISLNGINGNGGNMIQHHHHLHSDGSGGNVTTNGSSSSS